MSNYSEKLRDPRWLDFSRELKASHGNCCQECGQGPGSGCPLNDGNREPRLSDLKDSGDIEAHADRVLLLFRPDMDKANKCEQSTHESLSERPRYFMELFQEKGRNVGTGSTRLWLRRELAKFELIAP